MTVPKFLLDIVACPKCHGKLQYREANPEAFDCAACKLRYLVENDIPDFRIEQAKNISAAKGE